ncbi:MAG: S8 family serine peptidase [Lentisphaerae bacterium]|nr:S8 family serine peptidase [Lentisphaerota bacterium]
MRSQRSLTLKLFPLLLAGITGFAPAASALFFRLDGDRLWLQADQTPLTEILEQFVRIGVDVRLDPRVQTTVTTALRGEDLDSALEILLAPHDYLLTWRMLRGPLGRIPKLQEIQVFQPGGRAAARRLVRPSNRFDSTRGVLGNAPEFVRDELLIGVRPGTTYERFQRLLDEIGGMMVDSDAATGVYLIRFPPGTNVEVLLQQVRRSALVAHAELNHVTRLPAQRPSSDREAPRLPDVRPPADGSIPVAVLDSGLDPQAGLSAVVSAAWDAVSPERELSDPAGHGTQMAYLAAGLIPADGAGTTGESLPVVSVRAFDEDGKTSNFAILQALAYAAQAGARVVNMSWGSETDSEFMRTAMQVAADRGMLLVAAAGNTPDGIPVYPAAYPDVMAVGGVTAAGQPWAHSNHGDFIALSAPATATLPVGHNGPAGAYAGTSISSAVAAHALAQYLNRHPGASAADARAALQAALSPAPDGCGAGVLDTAALQRLLGP